VSYQGWGMNYISHIWHVGEAMYRYTIVYRAMRFMGVSGFINSGGIYKKIKTRTISPGL
jgi:hypothetical protein